MSSKRDAETSELGTLMNESPWALNYKSFLVRVWRDDDESPWRASITQIHTQETRTFITVQALLLFLHEQVTAVQK